MSNIISPLGQRILFSLAMEGRGSVGEIAERTGGDKSSIYGEQMPGNLTDLELVQYTKERRKKYGKKPKIYFLSIKGLVALFNFMDDFWEKSGKDRNSVEVKLLKDVSRTHEFLLPKIFDKWDSFGKRNVKITAIESFKLVMEETGAANDIRSHKTTGIETLVPDDDYRKSFTVSFFSLPLSGRVYCDDLEAWIDVMTSDEELVDMFVDFYEKQRKNLSRLVNSREILENKIKKNISLPHMGPFHLPLLSHKILEILKDPEKISTEEEKGKSDEKVKDRKGVSPPASKIVQEFVSRGMHITPEALEELRETPNSKIRRVLSHLDEKEERPSVISLDYITQVLESVEGEEKREPPVSEKAKDEVLSAVEKLEGEDGAEISDLATEVGESASKTEEILDVLLKEDKVYEPIAGKFKRL